MAVITLQLQYLCAHGGAAAYIVLDLVPNNLLTFFAHVARNLWMGKQHACPESVLPAAIIHATCQRPGFQVSP